MASPQRLVFRPANRKEIGAVFDQIDKDGSGWLSLVELREALKGWQATARDVLTAQQDKEKEVTPILNAELFADESYLQKMLRYPHNSGACTQSTANAN